MPCHHLHPVNTAASPALVGLFACASGLSVANVYYAQPLLDQIAADFAINPGAAGGVMAATQVGSVLALLLVVPLGDQLNRRTLMLAQIGALVAERARAAIGDRLRIGDSDDENLLPL